MVYVRNCSDNVCGNEKKLGAGREAVMDLPNRSLLWKAQTLVEVLFCPVLPDIGKSVALF
jgi:hypothetical protein